MSRGYSPESPTLVRELSFQACSNFRNKPAKQEAIKGLLPKKSTFINIVRLGGRKGCRAQGAGLVEGVGIPPASFSFDRREHRIKTGPRGTCIRNALTELHRLTTGCLAASATDQFQSLPITLLLNSTKRVSDHRCEKSAQLAASQFHHPVHPCEGRKLDIKPASAPLTQNFLPSSSASALPLSLLPCPRGQQASPLSSQRRYPSTPPPYGRPSARW